MDQTRAALGGKQFFEHNGTRYVVSLIDQKVKLDFRAWLESNARAEAAAMCAELPASAHRDIIKAVSSDISTGAYSFASELSNQALNTWAGTSYLLSLLFFDPKTKRHPSTDETDAIMTDHPVEIGQLLETIYADSFPNSRRAAERKKTPPESESQSPEEASDQTP